MTDRHQSLLAALAGQQPAGLLPPAAPQQGGLLGALMGYEPPQQPPGALQSLMQQPPANPLTPIAGGIANLLGLKDAYRALSGGMTDWEARDFALGSALGMLPMARGARPLLAAEKGLGSAVPQEKWYISELLSGKLGAAREGGQASSSYYVLPSGKRVRVSDHPAVNPRSKSDFNIIQSDHSPWVSVYGQRTRDPVTELPMEPMARWNRNQVDEQTVLKEMLNLLK